MNKFVRYPRLLGVAVLAIVLAACGRDNVEQITNVHVDPGAAVMPPGPHTLLIGEFCSEEAGRKRLSANRQVVRWTSSDESVATVTQIGLVVGVSEGDAIITAVLRSGTEITTSFFVSGAACPPPVAPTVEIRPSSGLSLFPSTCSTSGPSTGQLEYFVDGARITTGVTWSSSDQSIATVSGSGLVTARKAGQVTITATNSQGSAQVTLTVNQCPPVERVLASIDYVPQGDTLLVGESVPAQATCRDQLEDVFGCPELTWVSTNPSRVSVSSTGVIICLREGSAEISVRTPDGGPSRSHAFTCVAVQPTFTITPSNQTFSLGMVGGVCSVVQQFTLRVDGVPTAASSWSISGGNITQAGMATFTTAGTYTVAAVFNGQPVTTQVFIQGSCPPVPGPTLFFTATPPALIVGQSANLAWQCNNGATLVATGGTSGWPGNKRLSDSQPVSPAVAGTYTYTLTCTGPGGSVSKSVTVTVSDPPPVITGIRFRVSPTVINACPATITVVAVVEGTGNFDRWVTLSSSRGNLVQVNDSTWTWQATTSGRVDFTARAVGNQAVTRLVSVQVNCPPPPSVISVDVQPEAQQCPMGGQAVFGARVETTGNASTDVEWSVTNNGVAEIVETTSNTVVLRCLTQGTAIVTARAKADLSMSDTGTLTAVPGQITCTWTTTQVTVQPDGSIRITVGQNITATAVCQNEHGVQFLPYWYSSGPSRVDVRTGQKTRITDPDTGVSREFWTGNTATITGIWNTDAQGEEVCVQATISQTTPAFCRKTFVD